MNRLLRRVYSVAAALSLLLCVLLSTMWGLTYRGTNRFGWERNPPPFSGQARRSIVVDAMANRNSLLITVAKWLPDAASTPGPDWKNFHRQSLPSVLGANARPLSPDALSAIQFQLLLLPPSKRCGHNDRRQRARMGVARWGTILWADPASTCFAGNLVRAVASCSNSQTSARHSGPLPHLQLRPSCNPRQMSRVRSRADYIKTFITSKSSV